LPNASVFLKVDHKGSSGIRVLESDLTKARKQFELATDVPANAVQTK